MENDFFAFLDRMKYIERWQLMRTVRDENVMEHSEQVAILTHALCVINNKVFGGSANAEKAALMAVYHDCSEVITGDMPTPIKYMNENIQGAYRDIEDKAGDRLLKMVPENLKDGFSEYLKPDRDSVEYRLMKAADKISAYIKCLEEARCGNDDFKMAEDAALADIRSRDIPEANYFLDNFIAGYTKTLDELGGVGKLE